FCYTCRISFDSEEDYKWHISEFPHSHFSCISCPPSDAFLTHDQLQAHLEQNHASCSLCHLAFINREDVEKHEVRVHNKCLECGEFFSCYWDLLDHQVIHAEPSCDCVLCDREFTTDSAWVLHLERRQCPSGINRGNVNGWAKDCDQSEAYLGKQFSYKCPTCDWEFQTMGTLLEHVEGDECAEDLGDGERPLAMFLCFMRRGLINIVNQERIALRRSEN
ncbi:hypothetical protein M431DRAFT_93124, partial [Trichoderma harzianum CBS 226.95]